jgi:hypothetical protein
MAMEILLGSALVGGAAGNAIGNLVADKIEPKTTEDILTEIKELIHLSLRYLRSTDEVREDDYYIAFLYTSKPTYLDAKGYKVMQIFVGTQVQFIIDYDGLGKIIWEPPVGWNDFIFPNRTSITIATGGPSTMNIGIRRTDRE